MQQIENQHLVLCRWVLVFVNATSSGNGQFHINAGIIQFHFIKSRFGNFFIMRKFGTIAFFSITAIVENERCCRHQQNVPIIANTGSA